MLQVETGGQLRQQEVTLLLQPGAAGPQLQQLLPAPSGVVIVICSYSYSYSYSYSSYSYSRPEGDQQQHGRGDPLLPVYHDVAIVLDQSETSISINNQSEASISINNQSETFNSIINQ